MSTNIAIRLSIALLSLLPALVSAAGSDDPALKHWLDARYEEELAFSPMDQATLGRKQAWDQIDDYSEEALDAQLSWQLDSASQLQARFDRDALSVEDKVSYDYWLYRAQRASEAARWRRHDYVFDQVDADHTDLPQFLINYHSVASVEDMQAYIARLGGIARALDQLLERARLAAGEGIRSPRFAYDIVLEQSRSVIRGAPFSDDTEEAPLWADIKSKSAALREEGLIDAGQERALRESARQALLAKVRPAYQRLISWLEQDRKNTDAQAQGVHALPEGQAYYAHRLRQYTTTDLSADEIHQLGLDEVARIRREMSAVKDEVGFEGSLADFFEFVRNDDQFYYADTDEGRRAFMDETRHYLDLINKRLPEYFGILPRAELEVRRVEAFRERDGAAAFYESGTADGSRPGVYYMHLSDMRANNLTDLQTTAYHEGNPGHHMQGSIALERDELPLFRTNVWYSAYGEGWALYSELLAWEMGLYDKPYYNFGRLGAEMFRAIRLVVDTGLHAKAWSEEQAVQYMLDNSAIPETSVRSEIQRYLAWPGQATSYKVGMLKILELRESARKALGERFDIRQFHDVILGGGSLPLSILELRVDDWVAQAL